MSLYLTKRAWNNEFELQIVGALEEESYSSS